MNRLQKKCTIASTGFHLLLAGILIVGPGFLSSKSKTDDSPVLDFIPANLVDQNVAGGGSPTAKPPPAALPTPPQPPAPPVVQPPKPTPPAPQKQIEPDPPKDAPKDPPKDVPRPRVKVPDAEAEAPAERKRPLPNVPTTPVKSRTKPDKTASKQPVVDTAALEMADRNRRIADTIQSTARSLKDNVSSATTVETPGTGGGEAYANYEQVVRSIYTHAWIAPDDTASDEAVAQVSVTIASDGNVISASITKSSGDASVDRSVQRALDRVTFVAPFPKGVKDKQRTYPINFNLKAKRMLG